MTTPPSSPSSPDERLSAGPSPPPNQQQQQRREKEEEETTTTITTTGSSSSSKADDDSARGGAAADMTRLMMCGGLAGMIAKTATNPLDRIRMLSQTGEHGVVMVVNNNKKKKPTTLQLYSSIIRNEGILGLWAGNGANLLRVFPSKSIIFSTNDLYRTKLGTLYHRGSYDDYLYSGKYLPWSLSFLCGGMAGMTASSITYPLDLARGRIAGKIVVSSEGGGVKHYRGIINTVLVTAREEGVLALYKGVSPTLLGAMPYEGIKFGTVAILERAFPRKRWTTSTTRGDGEEEENGKGKKDDDDDNSNNNGISVSDVTRKLLFGGAGGVTASVITYPNDTVRRFLQLQGSRGTTEHFDGYWDCVRKTYAKYGVERFYRGAFINIVRMAPNTAIQFGSYELLKQCTAGYF